MKVVGRNGRIVARALCHQCGTVFEYDSKDDVVSEEWEGSHGYPHTSRHVPCPSCGAHLYHDYKARGVLVYDPVTE